MREFRAGSTNYWIVIKTEPQRRLDMQQLVSNRVYHRLNKCYHIKRRCRWRGVGL